jgi:hypothetical protein
VRNGVVILSGKKGSGLNRVAARVENVKNKKTNTA